MWSSWPFLVTQLAVLAYCFWVISGCIAFCLVADQLVVLWCLIWCAQKKLLALFQENAGQGNADAIFQ